MQLPIQRLILIFFMEATMAALDIITEATMATLTTDTTARGLLMQRLPLLLQPTPRPTPGCTTVLVATTAATTVATHTTALVTAMATTGASKKSTSIAGLTGMKCQ